MLRMDKELVKQCKDFIREEERERLGAKRWYLIPYYVQHEIRNSLDVVQSLVTKRLNRHQIVALASFVFCVGAPAFRRSVLLKKLNAGASAHQVAKEIRRWRKSADQKLAFAYFLEDDLPRPDKQKASRQRMREAELFLIGCLEPQMTIRKTIVSFWLDALNRLKKLKPIWS